MKRRDLLKLAPLPLLAALLPLIWPRGARGQTSRLRSWWLGKALPAAW